MHFFAIDKVRLKIFKLFFAEVNDVDLHAQLCSFRIAIAYILKDAQCADIESVLLIVATIPFSILILSISIPIL